MTVDLGFGAYSRQRTRADARPSRTDAVGSHDGNRSKEPATGPRGAESGCSREARGLYKKTAAGCLTRLRAPVGRHNGHGAGDGLDGGSEQSRRGRDAAGSRCRRPAV